jgi:hypothetical protein
MNKPYTWKNKARRNMTVVGKIMWWTWAIRIHKDGDGFGIVNMWWHPLTYLLILFAMIPCMMTDNRLQDEVRFSPKSCWKDKEIEWLTHFD